MLCIDLIGTSNCGDTTFDRRLGFLEIEDRYKPGIVAGSETTVPKDTDSITDEQQQLFAGF